MAPPCRLIQNQLTTIVVPVFDWQLILMESRPWSPGTSSPMEVRHLAYRPPWGNFPWGCHHPFVGSLIQELGFLLSSIGGFSSARAHQKKT